MPSEQFAVLMAGGRGERFWPLSRVARPKHLVPLPTGRSLLEEAFARLAPLFSPDRILVVTGADCAGEVRRRLPALPPQNLLAEPLGRDTAAAIGWAATELVRRAPGTAFAAMPADHVVADADRFRGALARALERAHTGALVTLGIPPRGPETTWGYIERGEPRGPDCFAAARFHEKPDAAVAASYVASGRFFWNAGIFAWRADRILEELRRHLPALADGLARLGNGAAPTQVYPSLPRISIDYAVLEKADRVEVVAADFGLEDIGGWEAFARRYLPDPQGPGALEARDCLVFSDAPDHLVALLGVQNLVVVHTADATLVCPRSRVGELKRLVEELRRRGLERYL
jgi:mannose-1-phosphate guanylyltransferase